MTAPIQPDPVADYLSQHAPQSDDPVAKYLGMRQKNQDDLGVAGKLRQSLLPGLLSSLGPVGMMAASGVNAARGTPLSPQDVMTHGLTQGLDDKAVAAIRGVAQSISGGSKFADAYKAALADQVARRSQGMEKFGVAGQIGEGVAGAIPWMAAGGAGLIPESASLLGKLGIGAAVGAGAGGIQAAAGAKPGQELQAAKGAALPGALMGGALGGVGSMAENLARPAFGPPDAALSWMVKKLPGLAGKGADELYSKLDAMEAKRPTGAPPVAFGQVVNDARDDLIKDFMMKHSRASPRSLSEYKKAATEHFQMAQPYYREAYPQQVPLSDGQSRVMGLPEVQAHWQPIVDALGKRGQVVPATPTAGQPVTVEAVDMLKKSMDRQITGDMLNYFKTKDVAKYDSYHNMMGWRDAIVQPVKEAVPAYHMATATSEVGQFVQGAIRAGNKAENTRASKIVNFPLPTMELPAAMILSALHSDPAYALGAWGVRLATMKAMRAVGDMTQANGARLLLEPAKNVIPKLAGGAAPASSAVPAGLGALGGSGGAALTRDDER